MTRDTLFSYSLSSTDHASPATGFRLTPTETLGRDARYWGQTDAGSEIVARSVVVSCYFTRRTSGEWPTGSYRVVGDEEDWSGVALA